MDIDRGRGVRITAQLNTKVFDHYGTSKHQWFSEPLSDYGFDEPQYSFFADNIAFTLSEDGDSYEIKSAVKEECVINVVVRRSAPGFMAGKDGTSYFGTDPSAPWGSMRHVFWPRCAVEGTVQTKEKTYDVKGKGVYIMALQGMKPHHLAERWNFINLQTPTYSAVMMEYTTPLAYGRTTVNVGGIVKDGELVYAGVTNSAKHVTSRQDTDVDWPEPRSVAFSWQGKTSDGQDISAIIEGDLPEKAERIDVMGHSKSNSPYRTSLWKAFAACVNGLENLKSLDVPLEADLIAVPGVIKSIVAGVAATRPYIYQVSSEVWSLNNTQIDLP